MVVDGEKKGGVDFFLLLGSLPTCVRDSGRVSHLHTADSTDTGECPVADWARNNSSPPPVRGLFLARGSADCGALKILALPAFSPFLFFLFFFSSSVSCSGLLGKGGVV